MTGCARPAAAMGRLGSTLSRWYWSTDEANGGSPVSRWNAITPAAYTSDAFVIACGSLLALRCDVDLVEHLGQPVDDAPARGPRVLRARVVEAGQHRAARAGHEHRSGRKRPVQDPVGVRVRQAAQHVPDDAELPVGGQGALRVGQAEQQRARADVLEHEDVLAVVLVGEEVPAGDDAVVRTAGARSMWYALLIATRSAARHALVLERVGLVDAQQDRGDGGAVELAFRARYSVTSACSLDSPSDSITSQWPNRLRPVRGSTVPSTAAMIWSPVLADVPEEARPDPLAACRARGPGRRSR